MMTPRPWRTCMAEQRIDELVVGLPLLPSGDEGDQATAARAWADAIGRRLGRPVSMQDERFTSRAAEATVGPARRRHDGGPPGQAARSGQRAAVDREAARRILQAALDARARGAAVSDMGHPDPPPVRMAHRIGPGRPHDEHRDEARGGTVIRGRGAGRRRPPGPAASGTMSRMDFGRQGGRNGYGMLRPHPPSTIGCAACWSCW